MSKKGVAGSMSSSVEANSAPTFASNRCCLLVSGWFFGCRSRKGWSSCASAIAGESSHPVVGAKSPQSFVAFWTSSIESFFSGVTVMSAVLHAPSFWMVVRMACASLEEKTG